MTKRPPADWKALRELLFTTRAKGMCEVSGQPLDFETFDLHHRRNKGMGGTSRPDTDLPSNLLAVDPVVHNGGPRSVHGRRVFSQAQGWLISKENIFKPVSVPVFVATGPGLGRWALLDDQGGRAYLGPVLRLPDE
jgi:hypothetical protein